MIRQNFEECHNAEWIEKNISNRNHELVILSLIIPWEKIIRQIAQFYNKNKGPAGKSLRIMAAILIFSRFRNLSDREVVKQVKENRYIQYFCNVPDTGLHVFLHPSTLCVFRKRIGEKGAVIIEKEVFEMLRCAGAVKGNDMLADSTVLESNIVYPNDVQLIYKAFKKMRAVAKLCGIRVWWDDKRLKKLWRDFNSDKKRNGAIWLGVFNEMFVPALKAFQKTFESAGTTDKRKKKAGKLLCLLNLLEKQTERKLNGERHIKDRIVSLDDPDARPIKKGKSHPDCEFGTTVQMTFNRDGFMITVENFIGNPNDKILYGDTLDLFKSRMKGYPDTVVTDLGFRSRANFNLTPPDVVRVFMGRSTDVTEEKQDFCKSARSATEGFIAVAKNHRGFGRSLYHGLKGHRVWSLLCQTAYNLKKFLQLCFEEKIEENSLIKLKLA